MVVANSITKSYYTTSFPLVKSKKKEKKKRNGKDKLRIHKIEKVLKIKWSIKGMAYTMDVLVCILKFLLKCFLTGIE